MGTSILAGLAGLATGTKGYLQDKAASDRQAALDAQNAAQQKRMGDMAMQQLQNAISGQQMTAQEHGFLPTNVAQEAQGAAQQNTADLGKLVSNPNAKIGSGQDMISRLQNAISIGGTPYTRQAAPDALTQAMQVEQAKAAATAREKADAQKFTANQNDLNRANRITAQQAGAALTADRQARAPHYQTFDEPNPDGTVSHTVVNLTGKDGQTVGDVQGKGKGSSAGGMQNKTLASMLTAYHNAKDADSQMTSFENDVIGGKRQLGPLDNAAATTANPMHPATGILGNVGQALAQSYTSGDQPLADYARNKSVTAEARSAILPRPNVTNLMIEREVTGIQPGQPNPTMATSAQLRRKQGLADMRQALINMGANPDAGPGAPTAAPANDVQTRAAAIKAKYGIATP